ncbi:MAG: tetratricopeptide repeat protein [Chloroflexi bacterium]|nr:tetratricopeptide repeat protein [Chloroflexota bacterium]
MARKRKNKSGQRTAQSAASLRLNGLRVFQRGDYQQAITTWERISVSMRPVPALTEAYFRRGLERFYDSETDLQVAGLDDLQKASNDQPNDPTYAYHLGLAASHLGNFEQAVYAYRVARQEPGEIAARAAYPLAWALLQQDQAPDSDPVWADLSDEERAMLRDISAFRRRPYALSPEAPQLWHALVALDAGDHSTALAGLTKTDGTSTETTGTSTEKGIAHYYRGVLAAQTEDWDTARSEWLAAYAAGFRSPQLSDNLAELFHQTAEELLAGGDSQTALSAAQESARHKSNDKSLNELLAQIHQHLGYQAASANQWDKAQTHWQTATELDSGSFRLVYNLALSYERSGNYRAAGDTWREALRHRPRRADHPDAISDEQVARLWQRAAEAYRKAGRLNAANKVYQQAIKWSPENPDLHLAMADVLLSDGRVQAAQNAMERILKRDPDHIPTLIRMGEVLFRNEQWLAKTAAPSYWKRALKLQPANLQALHALAEWYLDQAEIDYSWDRFDEAIENYQKSLEYQPEDARALSCIANCCIHLGNLDQASEYTNRAITRAPGDLDVLREILGGWIKMHNPGQAWAVLEQAEIRNASIPGTFYLAQATKLLNEDCHDSAIPWLERAAANAAPGKPMLFMIGKMMMEYDDNLARQYLKQAIDTGQNPGQAYLSLSFLEEKAGNLRISKKHLAEAERIARKTNDRDLAEKAHMARLMSGVPQATIKRLMDMGGPDMVEDFLSSMGSVDYEDYFYDD